MAVRARTLAGALVGVQLVAVLTGTHVAASCVETRVLAAGVQTRYRAVALIHVDARPTVTGQRVADRTRAHERAGRVAALELAHRLAAGTLVDVDALALPLRAVHLVAGVAQTPVRAESVDAAAVLARARHQTTLVQVWTQTAPPTSRCLFIDHQPRSNIVNQSVAHSHSGHCPYDIATVVVGNINLSVKVTRGRKGTGANKREFSKKCLTDSYDNVNFGNRSVIISSNTEHQGGGCINDLMADKFTDKMVQFIVNTCHI